MVRSNPNRSFFGDLCSFPLTLAAAVALFLLALPACKRKSDAIEGKPKTAADKPAEVATLEPAQIPSEADAASEFNFLSLGPESGLDFTRQDDMRGQRRIIESTGGGVGMIDIDGDGLLDLFYTGGCRVPEELNSVTPTCALFRNQGQARFRNCTAQSMLLMPGYCQGCAVGDIDGDGFDDLYVTGFGRNGLWRNNGDGTFENITDRAGVQDLSWSTSCAFADFNLDGHLDLYVVNYLAESPHTPLLCPNPNAPQGYEQCPPSKYEGVDDKLFISDGTGRFLDLTNAAGVGNRKGKGLGVVVSDLNRDQFPEIYVANDGQANFLFTPTKMSIDAGDESKKISFDEVALSAGAALSGSGYAQASMGIAAGDHDQNGMTDLLLTHFVRDSNTLYHNQGDLQFKDLTRTSGLLGPSKSVLGWGTVMEDFDGDGLLDLFVANGHVEDRTWLKQGEDYRMPAQLFKNIGGGRFNEVSPAGDYFKSVWLGRGVAAGDLDGDGRIDLAVSHQLDGSVALLNRTGQYHHHHQISLKLVGIQSNRSAIGAKVTVEDATGQLIAYREIIGGGSFQAASARDIHIAIAGKSGSGLIAESDYRIHVQWATVQRTKPQRVALELGDSQDMTVQTLIVLEAAAAE